jgi:DNA-binding NtrC family response regulator
MILCVEDDVDSCEVVSEMIERSGRPYGVRSVHNTEDAMTLIREQRFDLYVLDTWMPEIGGLRLTKFIRETDPATPIVFFTAIDSSANRKKALSSGATAFLAKPDDIDELVSTIIRLLEGETPQCTPGNGTVSASLAC